MLEHVLIENYKSIRLADIRLDRLNILIGPNGSGKSNFISFFELVQNILDKNLGGYILGNGGIDRFLYQGRKHSESIRGLVNFNNQNAFFFTLKPTLGDKAYIAEAGNFLNSKKGHGSNYMEDWDKTILDINVEESDMINNTYRNGYVKSFVKSFTVYHFHDTSLTSKMRGSCNVDDNFILRHDGSNLAAFLYRMQENNPREFRLIENSIRAIAPYFRRFRLAPMAANPSLIKLEWEENNSDMYLDAYSFSDGTLRFIALATVLLQPDLPNTIIIDEPELGLHPAAINLLSALIKKASKKTQLIISSQSADLINNFEPENIIVVDRKGKDTNFNRLNSNDLKIWMDDYSMGEIWEKNLIGGRP